MLKIRSKLLLGALVLMCLVSAPSIGMADVLAATLAADRHLALVDSDSGAIERIEVGAAPWGLAADANGLIYVTTAQGLAVVDPRRRQRLALIDYALPATRIDYGEYRAGGMGLAVSRDGRWVYVGIHRPRGGDVLALIDTRSAAVVRHTPIGKRPFDVVLSADERQVYSIDHDSYSVTRIDTASLHRAHVDSERLPVAPLGRGGYAKPHYAALDGQGRLLLAVQGRALVRLDPRTGQSQVHELTSDTHQHDLAIAADGRTLVIVGTGAAGAAAGGPNLSVFDLTSERERVIPLHRPHEGVAISADGRRAFLGGGYTMAGAWDGITEVELASGRQREISVPGRPQALLLLRSSN